MGIVNEVPQAPAQAAPPTAPVSPDPAKPAGAPEYTPNEDGVTAQEQEMYDVFVTACLQNIYSKEGFPITLQKLGSGKDEPVKIIGHTAAMVTRSVIGGIKQQGNEVPQEIWFQGMQEVVEQLLEISVGAGIIKQGEDEQIAEEVYYEALRVIGQTMQDKGEITPEMRAEAAADLKESTGKDLPQQPAAAPTSNQPPAQPAPAGVVNQAGA